MAGNTGNTTFNPLIAGLQRERPFLTTFSSASMALRGLSVEEMSSSGTDPGVLYSVTTVLLNIYLIIH